MNGHFGHKSFFVFHQVLIDLTHEDITKGWTQWLVTF